MKQRIIFYGSGDYTFPIIKVLKRHGLILVVTTEKEAPFTQFLKQENVQYMCSSLNRKEDIEKISDSNPTLGVLASYGAIIPKKVLRMFPLGIFNIHPSLLPKYKGPSPIQSTILSGEKETGVTIITLDEQVDHGPIVAQKKIALEGAETAEELIQKLFAIGAEMIDQLLQGDSLKTTEQNHTQESFTKRLTRDAGFIDIHNPPNPIMLDRMIRAYHPWPGVWLKYQISKNERAKRLYKNQKSIIKLLPNQKIQVEGKSPMSYKDFINGYQQAGKRLLEQLGLFPFS